MIWLTNLPSWISFVTIVAAANIVSLAMVLLVRGWERRHGVTAGPAVVTAWATVLGALSAVLCAFTIITLWSILGRAQAITDNEAAAIRLAARDIAPNQLSLLRAYVTGSAQEWPQMCGGKPDQRVVAALIALEHSATPRQPAYASDLNHQLETLEDLRYQRWQISNAAAPPELSITICIVALALFGVLAIASPERLDAHVALTVLVATALGASFWVMAILAYPYCGSYSIGPGQIVSALQAHPM